jgi:hypothetical protein
MSSNAFPNNPLPPLWEAFQILQEALSVARRAVKLRQAREPQCQQELLRYQGYLLNHNNFLLRAEQPQMAEELTSKIKFTEDESKSLFVLDLWALFERFLRHYLQHKGEALKQTVTPLNLADSLYQHFTKEVEYWKPAEILNFLKDSLFSTEAGRNLIGAAKQILEYRNWVAHGKNANELPAVEHFEPSTAYQSLNEIVETLLMHYP